MSPHAFNQLLPGRYPAPTSPYNFPSLIQRWTPRTQQCQPDDSSNHTTNPESENISSKNAAQKLETCQALDPLKTTNKQASIIKTSLIPPIPTEGLMSGLNFGPSILHKQSNPVPTHYASTLISKPRLDKSNFICPMVLSCNVTSTAYILIPLLISWHSTPCSTHSPFALQTSGIQIHVVRATESGYTKPRDHILGPKAQHIPNHVSTFNKSPATLSHKRTPLFHIWLNYATL